MEQKLVNYMEVVVDHTLPHMLKAFPDFCACNECILDVKALALNNLQPHYVVTEKGELYTRIDEMRVQFEADVMKALVEAILRVKTQPRHGA